MRIDSLRKVPPKLWQEWLSSIRQGGLIREGDRILAAVSGGPDSVALLHLLSLSASHLGITVAAAHLDHGLRGEESAADARFVQELGRALDIPVIIESASSRDLNLGKGVSLEAAARETRYAFLESAALAAGAGKIATGHTADDQAETFLLRLLRGSGGRGLRGILPRRADWVIRPLLDIRRSDLLTFLEQNKISYRMDSTNGDSRFLRNRIRREVVPLLEAINPSIVATLARQAKFLSRDEACLDELTDKAVRNLNWRIEEGSVSISAEAFLAFPAAVRHRILIRALDHLVGVKREHGLLRQEDAIERIAVGRAGRHIQLGDGTTVEKRYGLLRLFKLDTAADTRNSTDAVSRRVLAATFRPAFRPPPPAGRAGAGRPGQARGQKHDS